MAPEHKRLRRYSTVTLDEIKEISVLTACAEQCHLYLWVPNALLREGLDVMDAWGFTYKTNIVWHKVPKDGGPDGRGVGFYFRNTTELVLFGVRGQLRTLKHGRRQVNIIKSRKREHSRKPKTLPTVRRREGRESVKVIIAILCMIRSSREVRMETCGHAARRLAGAILETG